MPKKGKREKQRKQRRMLKGTESMPKPMGDHKEKQIVAIKATVGGATNIEIKLANLHSCRVSEFSQLLFLYTIESSTTVE
jgi:hypothetical protein